MEVVNIVVEGDSVNRLVCTFVITVDGDKVLKIVWIEVIVVDGL